MGGKMCEVEGCDRSADANGMCAMHNVRVWRNGHTDLVRTRRRCQVDECDRWVVSHGYCELHWRRVQKWGDPHKVGKRQSSGPTINHNGYVVLQEPEHPLAMASGQVLEHRMILYDRIGPGPHSCYICGKTVSWQHKDQRRRIAVDHLDNNPRNNDPSNLRVCCQPCNVRRPSTARTACNAGHEYTPENTYVGPDGSRRCRICMRAYDRKRRPRGTPR